MLRKAVSAGGCAFTIVCSLPSLFPLAAQGAPGQARAGPPTDIISVDVDLVVLHASVRDRKGGFVSGLGKENFRILENGALQDIRVFQSEDMPVAVGLIVDNSGSMGRKKKDVTAAALVFAHSSNPEDQMFVVNFNGRISVGLPDTELFSARPSELEHAINDAPATGRTALYDAIETGLARLGKATLDKKVLIVISDGEDNASHRKLGRILESAERSEVIIYTIGLFDEDHDSNPGVLRKIARATGGEAFLPDEMSEVVPICKRIAEDIRTQYTLGYVSSNQNFDNTYRAIAVAATGGHGEKLIVRARAGYIASPERRGQPAGSQAKLR